VTGGLVPVRRRKAVLHDSIAGNLASSSSAQRLGCPYNQLCGRRARAHRCNQLSQGTLARGSDGYRLDDLNQNEKKSTTKCR
jgi:hypothetical protein